MGILGDTLTAATKFSPASLFSGGTPSLGPIASFQYNISPFSRQASLATMMERNLLKSKSKFLPNWLNVNLPISGLGNHSVLGQAKQTSSLIKSISSPEALVGSAKSLLGISPDSSISSNKAALGNSSLGRSSESTIRSVTKPGIESGRAEIGRLKSAALGFAKPSRFKVRIVTNPALRLSNHEEDVSMSCSATTLPGKSLATIEDRRGSPNLTKKPYDVIYEEVKMTFQMSNSMKEHDLFLNWMDFIYNRTGKNFAYPMDYYSDISILQLNESFGVLKTVKLIQAYPINVSEVSLSYESTNAIETFDVIFAYREWI